jgi:hypothetical protein
MALVMYMGVRFFGNWMWPGTPHYNRKYKEGKDKENNLRSLGDFHR